MTLEQFFTIASPIIAGAGAYYGALGAIRIEMARFDERLQSLRRDYESDHAKLDEHLTDRTLHADCVGGKS